MLDGSSSHDSPLGLHPQPTRKTTDPEIKHSNWIGRKRWLAKQIHRLHQVLPKSLELCETDPKWFPCAIRERPFNDKVFINVWWQSFCATFSNQNYVCSSYESATESTSALCQNTDTTRHRVFRDSWITDIIFKQSLNPKRQLVTLSIATQFSIREIFLISTEQLELSAIRFWTRNICVVVEFVFVIIIFVFVVILFVVFIFVVVIFVPSSSRKWRKRKIVKYFNEFKYSPKCQMENQENELSFFCPKEKEKDFSVCSKINMTTAVPLRIVAELRTRNKLTGEVHLEYPLPLETAVLP